VNLHSLIGAFTQETRFLQLFTPLGRHRLIAECVRGEEGISQGFRFDISALSTDAGIALKSLIGQPTLLQMLTVTSGCDLRPFHGHITSVEMNGSNGGLARYRLTMEPWLAFLEHGRDSRIFQDMSVFDILDAVFAAWQGRGRLVPSWRFDIAERAIYPIRSLTTQYQESDLVFVERLMSEEGLFHFFEHIGDPDSPSLGSHTMVIADHNGSFKPNAHASINFTQSSAVMKQDGLDRWRTEFRQQADAIDIESWDYRALTSRTSSGAGSTGGKDAAPMVTKESMGAYAFETHEQGQRMADNLLQAVAAREEVHIAAGTARTLSPGTTFAVHGHAQHDRCANDDERTFVVVRALHLMHNNLSAELKAESLSRLPQGSLASLIESEQASSLHAVGKNIGERPLYRIRIDAIRSSTPYRSNRFDENGALCFPRPTVRGQQSAIVVGPAGSVIHTDRDHRIKVQFHWPRGTQSHNRLAHPSPDSHTGAPGDDTAGTWVRVVTPVAGANWGSNSLPRVGQEVLIDFLGGDIDRPVVIGGLYNGKGQQDAQNNQVAVGAGAATGNAPAWFPGESGAHAHPAALSGFKTQAMSASQTGTGAYSQLVFDDSRGQSRVVLQRHAEPHKGTDELNLGQLRHQTDNQRLAPSGFGAELKTEHGNALRAGQGMLLSSNGRAAGVGDQMDSHEAAIQIEQSSDLQTDLASTAKKHNAVLKDRGAQSIQAAEKLSAIEKMKASATVIAGSRGGAEAGSAGGAGNAIAYGEAQIQVSSPAGIAAVTAVNAIFSAGDTSGISAAQDINFAAQGNIFNAVRSGITLFTYGKAASKEKPNQEVGIRLHAASGKVSSQSQSGETRITSDKAITVASVAKSVNVAAKTHLMLTAKGASIKLEGGDIQIHAPGKVEFKASMKELSGPKASSATLPLFPRSEGDSADQHFILKSHSGAPVKQRRYRALTGNQTIEGFTDESGRSKVLDGYLGQIARFELINETHDEHFIIRDPLGEPVANMRYKIRAADGVEVEGITDEDGRTVLFTSEKIESVELHFVADTYPEEQGAD
jgi:type VI secretion system secreted protein VgrG